MRQRTLHRAATRLSPSTRRATGQVPKIADRVHSLKVGQHFDVRGVGTDETSRNRFRSGLYAAARLDKVSVRGLPDGSVRVTKVGEWSSSLSERLRATSVSS
jgi:hypothetical protein